MTEFACPFKPGLTVSGTAAWERRSWIAALMMLVLCLSLKAAPPHAPAIPHAEDMELVFSDEFDGTALNTNLWQSQAYEKTPKNDTARGPQNLEVKGGELRLYIRKESRGSGNHKTSWTAGYVFTREPIQPNSFIEARFRAGQASGVNNAFWLACVANPGNAIANKYEVDIVEARQDSRKATPTGSGHLAWHDWKTIAYAVNAKGTKDHIAQGVQVPHSFDAYHVWGLWLGERELIYYLDGKEVWRGSDHARYPDQWRTGIGKFSRWFANEEKSAYGRFGQDDWCYFGGYAGDQMNVVFSNLPWGETWSPLTDAADGTYMSVDYLRVYRPRRLTTTTPSQVWSLADTTGRASDKEWLKLAPGAKREIRLEEPFSVQSVHPLYVSVTMRRKSGAALSMTFQAPDDKPICRARVAADGNLRCAFDSEVTTAEAYPAIGRYKAPPSTNEVACVVRLTPAAGQTKAAISFCAFRMNEIPRIEPFFHSNIDPHGKTSLNNGWHINAKQATSGTISTVRLVNDGTAPLLVKDLKIGSSYPSVSRRGDKDIK